MSRHPEKREPGLTRRRFLQLSGASVGAALVAWAMARPARVTASPKVSPERMAILTDLTLCIGCRACESACNRVNKLPPPEASFADMAVFEKTRRTSAGAYTVVNRYPSKNGQGPIYRKLQCMHCNEPACVSVCPVAAMVKTPEGAVIWDERVCIGCRYCMVACPFYIPAYEYSSAFTPRVRKCVMCYERVFREGGIPACVEACPTKAIIFGKREELIQIAQQRINSNPEKYVNHIYGENEVGGTSWLYISPVPFDEVGLPNVEKTPYGEYSWDFLTAVPVVLILWPLFMVGLHHLTQRREQMVVEEALRKAGKRQLEKRQ